MSQSEFGSQSAAESDLDISLSETEQQILVQHSVDLSLQGELSPENQSFEINSLKGASSEFQPLDLSTESPEKNLEQEMQNCYAKNEQIHVLLYQAQEQLVLSQQVIECQEVLTETLQKRIEQLEHDLQIKSALIEQANSNCDELKERLKRQQHRNAQLKAAYEKRLETEAELPKEEVTVMESWAVAKLAEEKISPIPALHTDEALQNVVQIMPAAPETIAAIATNSLSELTRKNVTGVSKFSVPIPALPLDEHKIRAEYGVEDVDSREPSRFQESFQEISQQNQQQNSEPASLNQHAYPSKLLLSQVSMPKFMQVLSDVNSGINSNLHPESFAAADLETEATSATIANKRNTISSLAAVKLPQFPPLPSRRS
jgi:hypothetical protein